MAFQRVELGAGLALKLSASQKPPSRGAFHRVALGAGLASKLSQPEARLIHVLFFSFPSPLCA